MGLLALRPALRLRSQVRVGGSTTSLKQRSIPAYLASKRAREALPYTRVTPVLTRHDPATPQPPGPEPHSTLTFRRSPLNLPHPRYESGGTLWPRLLFGRLVCCLGLFAAVTAAALAAQGGTAQAVLLLLGAPVLLLRFHARTARRCERALAYVPKLRVAMYFPVV